jgi:type I restriction enzyme S subunit
MKTVAGVGGSLLRARPEGTGRIEIPLPPLDEQRRIARILDQADRLRRLRRHARQQTDTFLQSVFVDMFGDPVSNPNNWDETIVEEVLARPLKAGLYIPKERYSFDKTTGIEMVHMSDAFYESVQRGSLKRAILTDKEIQEYALDHNDLLIARRSLNYEGAAKPCHILRSSEPLVFESSILRVTLNQKKILPAYFFQFFMNERARRKYVLKNVTQSTISGINQSGLNNTKLLIPPLNLQKDFERIIKAVATLQTQQQEAERQAEMNFQALLHQAFSGQLAQKVVEV